ncbi:3-isopropylmalate dehydratase small subunit [Ramlibacter tataouinensis]|uniref:3-isopropylmalate dehydratase small subunit n=1 Tax=Ramlibacter tataouinensis (strain ATCC BAA-407 / DSM 14655 / LMG 21543 / TTB310) TaxID=365046 RepID=F5Y4Y3_RAMTT|nr:3-isopropylmalate dehydratase small subunit [Ramlibacter tataouinensis]AEG92639.1 Alpha-IPM isomerase [Ramlibacter tataouinensis TTB310]
MQAFTTLHAAAVPLDLANVDTDQIVPARFLRHPRSAGYGNFLFRDLRERDPEFILDRPEYRGAQILVTAENFGCGSSREAAVWALTGAGFRAWIAPSFGDIFFENSFKNAALPIVLPAGRVAGLRSQLHAAPGTSLAINLARQTLRFPDGGIEGFDVDPFRKECLLAGIDEIALTLRHEQEIAAYEARHLTPP